MNLARSGSGADVASGGRHGLEDGDRPLVGKPRVGSTRRGGRDFSHC